MVREECRRTRRTGRSGFAAGGERQLAGDLRLRGRPGTAVAQACSTTPPAAMPPYRHGHREVSAAAAVWRPALALGHALWGGPRAGAGCALAVGNPRWSTGAFTPTAPFTYAKTLKVHPRRARQVAQRCGQGTEPGAGQPGRVRFGRLLALGQNKPTGCVGTSAQPSAMYPRMPAKRPERARHDTEDPRELGE